MSKPTRGFLAGLLLAGLGSTALAQTNFTLNWYSLDAGGTLSTGGVYTVNGTLGQSGAGTVSGGGFTLQGGFWGVVVAVQSPGVPLLTIGRTNNLLLVSWPAPATGCVLEQTNRLSTLAGPWVQVPVSQYQTNAASVYFTTPPAPGTNFFRLRKPSGP